MPGLTASEVMDEGALLLNDSAKITFTYTVLTPWLKRAVNEFSDHLAKNSISLLRKAGVVVNPSIVGSTTFIPLLADCLIPIHLEERALGSSDNWIGMTQLDTINPNSTPQASFEVWAFQGTLSNSVPVIDVPNASSLREVRVTYQRFLPYSTISGASDLGGSLTFSSKRFLASKVAEFVSRFVLQNKARADELKAESYESITSLIQIWVKFQQANPVRRSRYTSPSIDTVEYLSLGSSGSGGASAPVTPIGCQLVCVKDFGAKGNAVFSGTDVVDTGTDDSDAFLSAIAYCLANRRSLFIPSAAYIIRKNLTIPDNMGIIFEKGAQIYWDDRAVPGTYLFTVGNANARGGGVHLQDASIILRTVTACGIDVVNSVKSIFDNLYIEGCIPALNFANPAACIATMSARSNIGVRVRMANAQECFWNVFNSPWLNHVHVGVQFPANNTVTQQFFNDVTMYGDSLYGDQSASGFVFQNGEFTVVNGGYFEAYFSGIGGAFQLQGISITGLRANDIVFDHANDVNNIYGGGPIIMNAIRSVVLSVAYPSDNIFARCIFTPSCVVIDDPPASKGNYIENNPTFPGVAWTATMRAATSGTITLTAGAGGNKCWFTKRGRECWVWGVLSVASVAAPVGRLFIDGLPLASFNDDANLSAVSLNCNGLQATATTQMQGYINRGDVSIEITRFAAGVASLLTAADIKAGSQIMFTARYISVPSA